MGQQPGYTHPSSSCTPTYFFTFFSTYSNNSWKTGSSLARNSWLTQLLSSNNIPLISKIKLHSADTSSGSNTYPCIGLPTNLVLKTDVFVKNTAGNAGYFNIHLQCTSSNSILIIV